MPRICNEPSQLLPAGRGRLPTGSAARRKLFTAKGNRQLLFPFTISVYCFTFFLFFLLCLTLSALSAVRLFRASASRADGRLGNGCLRGRSESVSVYIGFDLRGEGARLNIILESTRANFDVLCVAGKSLGSSPRRGPSE